MTLVLPRAQTLSLHSLLGQVEPLNNIQIRILHGLLGKKVEVSAVTSLLQNSLLSVNSNTYPHLCLRSHHFHNRFKCSLVLQTCLAEARAAKVLAREVQSVTGRFFVITFKVSLSQPSGDWPAEEVSSVSLALFTKRPVVFSRLDISNQLKSWGSAHSWPTVVVLIMWNYL